jgi:hypothetical protein
MVPMFNQGYARIKTTMQNSREVVALVKVFNSVSKSDELSNLQELVLVVGGVNLGVVNVGFVNVGLANVGGGSKVGLEPPPTQLPPLALLQVEPAAIKKIQTCVSSLYAVASFKNVAGTHDSKSLEQGKGRSRFWYTYLKLRCKPGRQGSIRRVVNSKIYQIV